jgi:hypothetical protein
MYTIDLRYETSHLERILHELHSQRRVLLTFDGHPFQELVPLPISSDALQAVRDHNQRLGWEGWRANRTGYMHEGKPVALVLRHTSCSWLQRMNFRLDDILNHSVDRLIIHGMIEGMAKQSRAALHSPVSA